MTADPATLEGESLRACSLEGALVNRRFNHLGQSERFLLPA